MKKTITIIGVSLVNLVIGAILCAAFMYTAEKKARSIALTSLKSEISTLNKYDALLDKHINLQKEYRATLLELEYYLNKIENNGTD